MYLSLFAAFLIWLALVTTFAMLCTVATNERESRVWGALVVATIVAGIAAATFSEPLPVF